MDQFGKPFTLSGYSSIENAICLALFLTPIFPSFSVGANPHGLGAPLSIDESQQQQQQQPAATLPQQQQLGAGAVGTAQAPAPQPQLMHPALAAINPAMHPAPAYQLARPATAAAGGVATPMGQPFYFPGVQQFAAAGLGGMAPPPRPRSKGTKAVGNVGAGKKQCNCKNSQCLKLYCECFASGRYCDGCNCQNCCNNRTNEDKRQSAIEAILDRNPNAFRPKIADEADEGIAVLPHARHNKGCNCKKSGCLKKYCECFQARVVCSENCKCVDCKNFEGSSARAIIQAHDAKQNSQNNLSRFGGGGGGGVRANPIGMLGAANVGVVPAGGIGSNTGAPPMNAANVQAALHQGMNQEQRQLAAKDALKEVISPEVVDKMSMLLMILANEEADRRATAGETDDSEQPPPPTEEGIARRKTLYEEQERLVLTEFRDTLRTVTRVVTDKVQKKVDAVNAKQNAIVQAIAAQQAQAHQQALQQAHAAAAQMAVAAGGTMQPNLAQAYRGGPIPPGMQPVYLMQGGRPQLVLLPQQALMAQQLAHQQQLAVAVQQQQQTQHRGIPVVKQEGTHDAPMPEAGGGNGGV
jgi:hypothetical protein